MLEDSRTKFIEKCYRLYEQKMFFVAKGILHDDALAEDCVHNAFLKLIESEKLFDDPESDECKRFILTIIKNCTIDVYRKRRIESERFFSLEEENVGKDQTLIDDQSEKEFVEMIKKLPDKYASIVMCLAIQGKSVKETAAELDISESAVRKRHERARKKLKAMMDWENDMMKR